MRQNSFDRNYSQTETQKLNSKSAVSINNDELTDEATEAVAGGSIPSTTPQSIKRNSSTYPSCSLTEAGVWESGGRFLEL